MWTTANRPKYNRDKLRYRSDLAEEWAHIEALIPPAKHGGRKRKVDVREVVNGIMYVLSTGCQWRYVPKDLPPKSTLYDYFDLWTYNGTLENIHHALYVKCREQIGREAPPAAIIDSQSVKSAEKRGAVSTHRATMQARKSTARKRHILVDFLGLLLHAIVYRPIFKTATEACSFSQPCSACIRFCKSSSPMADIKGRSFKNRCRRLAKDFENLTRNALAFLRLASIRLMLRKLCNQ